MKTGILERDQKWIWHPYSQHGLNKKVLPVRAAQGAYLELEDGRKILDAISSWWVNILGHSHPEIAKAIYLQASELEHVIFSGFTHKPAVDLAEALISHPVLKNAGLSRVFYSDNGSTAVEVALKMAYQFQIQRGSPRTHFLALRNAYHGDTLGAMAVGEPAGFHEIFRKLMPPVDFVEAGDLKSFIEKLETDSDRYAAFIFEPLVQGASGMKMYDASFLKEAVLLCKKKGILTIADEVFTGFYRTGNCFAIESAEIYPDMICLSKGITGGFLPLAVTIVQQEVFSGFLSDQIGQAFLHGHSYTANPISCAAALKTWEILNRGETLDRVKKICELTAQRISRLRNDPRGQAKNARALGTIGAVDLSEKFSYFNSRGGTLTEKAVAQGVLLRPLGSTVYAVPPYCCKDQEIHQIYDTIENIIYG